MAPTEQLFEYILIGEVRTEVRTAAGLWSDTLRPLWVYCDTA